MEVSLDLALANRLLGHLMDVLSTDEGELLFEAVTEQAYHDLAALGQQIMEAESPGFFEE